MKMPGGQNYTDLKHRVRELGLHTVCESASCPNIGECWNRQSLTIMILGGICTRSCQFCDVPTGRPPPPTRTSRSGSPPCWPSWACATLSSPAWIATT